MSVDESWKSSGIHFSFVDFDDCRKLFLSGELDIAMRGAQEAEFLSLVSQAPKGMAIIDLSGVSFCDSSGVNVLIKAARHMSDIDGHLRLVASPPWLEKILMVTEVTLTIPLFTTWDEARSAGHG